MNQDVERNRFYVSIPDHDPRFRALLAVVHAAQRPGRNSPVSRMLMEWALIGFSFQTSLLNGTTDAGSVLAASLNAAAALATDVPDLRTQVAEHQAIEESMAEFRFD